MESFAKSKTAFPTVSHHLLNLPRPVPTLGGYIGTTAPAPVWRVRPRLKRAELAKPRTLRRYQMRRSYRVIPVFPLYPEA